MTNDTSCTRVFERCRMACAAADWSLDDVLRLHEVLAQRGSHHVGANDVQAVLGDGTSADAAALVRILHDLHHSLPPPSPSPLRARAGRRPDSARPAISAAANATTAAAAPIDAAASALCCGMAIFCDAALADKLDVGFVVCSAGGCGVLDLPGVCVMLEGGLRAAQCLLRTYYAGDPPRGISDQGLRLLQYDWHLVEGLLRDGALAPLVQHHVSLAEGGGP